MLWVTKRIVVPVSRQTRRSSSFNRSRVISSSAPNGSSISRICGSLTSALAMDTRCRIPPDSSCGYECSQPLRPTSSSNSAGVALPLCFAPLATSSGSSTLASAVRHGSSAGSWNTKPMSRRRRAAPAVPPRMRMSPADGGTRSATARSSVDLPQPEGPSSVRNSPRVTSRSMPDNAVTLRWSVKNRTLMPRHATACRGSPLASGLAVLARPVIRLATAWKATMSDLGACVAGRAQYLHRHHFIELRRALRELPELRIERDLLLPYGGIHRAPAVGLGEVVERVVHHCVDADLFVIARQIRIFLDEEIGGRVAIRVRICVAARGRTQKFLQNIGPRLYRLHGRIVGQRVQANAGVPETQVDAVRAERLQRRDIRLPSGDDVDLSGQKR